MPTQSLATTFSSRGRNVARSNSSPVKPTNTHSKSSTLELYIRSRARPSEATRPTRIAGRWSNYPGPLPSPSIIRTTLAFTEPVCQATKSHSGPVTTRRQDRAQSSSGPTLILGLMESFTSSRHSTLAQFRHRLTAAAMRTDPKATRCLLFA